jgi:hypothetical protein
VEQFAGLFVIVAFVLWLVVFVPDRIRSKSITKNSGYEDKFSAGVRILKDAQKQLRSSKQEHANSSARGSFGAGAGKSTAFYESRRSVYARSSAVGSSVAGGSLKKGGVNAGGSFGRSLSKRGSFGAGAESAGGSFGRGANAGKMGAQKQNRGAKTSLAVSNLVCIISLVSTLLGWILVAIFKSGAVIAAVITLVYLIALLSNHLKKVVAMRTISRPEYAQTRAQTTRQKQRQNALPQQNYRQASTNSAFEGDDKSEAVEYANAQTSFERAKVLVGDFSPRKFTHNHSINSALQSQLDYASNLVSKFDAELNAIDRAGKSYRLKSGAKSKR